MLWSICISSATAQSASTVINRWISGEIQSAQAGRDFKFEEDEVRERGVTFLADMLRKDEKIEEIGTFLCITKPWSTGSDATDISLQRTLWNHARKNGDIASDVFKRLDCAGANRKNFYFDIIIEDMQDAKLQLCTHGEIKDLPKRTFRLINNIKKINTEILNDFGDSTVRSYYPLRNLVRAATVSAMRAVDDGVKRRSDAQAIRGLEETADLLKRLNRPDILIQTRNGWRFHSDLTILEAIYRAIANDNQASIRTLEEALNWPPVVKDMAIIEGIADDALSSILPDDYTDPIFIERLLPGASSDPEVECSRWRSRSYRVDAVADRALTCLSEIRGNNAISERIVKFDNCFEELVADDWRIQFASYPSVSEDVAMSELNKKKEKLLELNLSKVAELIKYNFTSRGMTVISTENQFTTNEINKLRPIIFENFGSVLYARAPQY